MRFVAAARSGAGSGPRRGAVCAALALAAVLAGGCDAPPEPASAPSPEASADASRYELRGEVVEVQPDQGTVVVKHEAIEGFMDAMTMPFNVRQEWVLDTAEPGARIRATLVVDAERSWLEDVIVNRPPAAGAAAQAVVRKPEPGTPVPVIRLVDQDGLELTLDEYDGGLWAFTFIYTRCPLPDFCPRVSKNFAQAYRAIEQDPERYGDARLLSITVDAEHDVPAVLREYGLEQLGEEGAAGFERWRFARAEPRPLGQLAHFTGLRFLPEAGEIVHSLRTVVVDPEGEVVTTLVGNTWEAAELLQALEEAAAQRRPQDPEER